MPLTHQLKHTLLPLAVKPCLISQHGFTLIEILVAVVVISLGLLGLAGLQVASLNNNQTAYYRAIATQQANDMMDRMRANLVGVTAANYDNLSATIPADPGCFSTGCSAANMAITDQFQWLTNNSAMLPGGSGTVRCIQGPANTCDTNTATSRNTVKSCRKVSIISFLS